MTPLLLTLAGIPPSKKNMTISRVISKQVPKVDGKGLKWQHRVMVFPSSDYQKWEEQAAAWLKEQALAAGESLPLPGPLHVGICYRCSDNRRWDLSNKDESVMDALVKAGVIEDDNRQIVRTRWTGWETCPKGEEGANISLDVLVPG